MKEPNVYSYGGSLKRGFHADEVVMLGLGALVVLATIYLIHRAIFHPCIEEKEVPAMCGGHQTCTFYNPQGYCISWYVSPTHACTETICTKRKP